ncbi:MAG: hypothetical protein K1X54_01470 [Flavobacteriales bacterium]|nr:hypothetical protein [Flavobacteriales bacterium]
MDVIDQNISGSQGKSLEQVLSEGYEFKFGNYLNAGFKLFGGDAAIYIAFTLLYFVISMAVGVIPYVSWLGGLILTPALTVGWFIYGRKQNQNRNRSFNNFFDGFNNNWVQLILQNLVTGIFVSIAAAIVILPFFMGSFFDLIGHIDDLERAQGDQEAVREIASEILGSGILTGILFAMLVASAVSVLYIYAPMFIVFRGMPFWDAMEASRKVVSKRYLQTALFLLVLGFMVLFSFLLCCIPILAGVPIMYLSMYAAFEDIMGTGDAE